MCFDFHRPQQVPQALRPSNYCTSHRMCRLYEERINAVLTHSGPRERIAVARKLLDQSPIAIYTQTDFGISRGKIVRHRSGAAGARRRFDKDMMSNQTLGRVNSLPVPGRWTWIR
jgi:hypothetical protein